MWVIESLGEGLLSERRVAGFKSESVAGFLLECVAGFVGIRRPMCGYDALSSSRSLLICGKSCRCQAENPSLNALSSFSRPALSPPATLPTQLSENDPRILAPMRLCRGMVTFEKRRDPRHRKVFVAGGWRPA